MGCNITNLNKQKQRAQNIEKAKEILEQEIIDLKEEDIEDGVPVWEKQDIIWTEILEWIKNYKKPNCPHCKKGRLHFAGISNLLPLFLGSTVP